MNYKHITIFELINRINFLIEAKKNIVGYFNQLQYDFMGHPKENEDTQILRQKINCGLKKTRYYISATGITLSIFYSSPPAIGGIQGNIDLFANLFNLHKFDVPSQTVIDLLDQSIGIYGDERKNALIRSLNPFWWLWKLVRRIMRFPFFLIKEAGFDSAKIENSFMGKLIKLTVSLTLLLGGGILPILAAFGYQENFVNYIKILFHL